LSVHLDLPLNHIETPVGWGAAEQRRRTVNQRGEHGGSLRRNPGASRQAMRGIRIAQGYQGIPEIRDVVTPGRPGPRTLTYSVALQMPSSVVLTADRLFLPEGFALLEGGAAPVAPQLSAGSLHALGSAEIYFQRPAERADGRDEYPSLFNPYWQARLTATSATERQVTAAARGLGVDPFGVLQ